MTKIMKVKIGHQHQMDNCGQMKLRKLKRKEENIDSRITI